MINVLSSIEIDSDPKGGWQLILWTGGVCNYSTPFRAHLQEIAEVLGGSDGAELELPPYQIQEDFIEGTLRINGTEVGVYYEHCLGYLSLRNESREVLGLVLNELKSIVEIVGAE